MYRRPDRVLFVFWGAMQWAMTAQGAADRLSFDAPRVYPVPGAVSVAVGNFNGDGRPDLAVTDGNYSTVAILLANGRGGFHPAVHYAVGEDSMAVAVGDFNGDGKLDLVVANSESSNISILLGNGDGTFRPQVTYAVGAGPHSVAVADFDGNGSLDLAVTNISGSVSILLGNGDGTFRAAVNYRLPR
jgi:hypothetical protein